MKILYLECSMGAAGDMLMAALTDLLAEPEDFLREMNGLGIPGVHLTREKAEKCGVCGNHVRVFVRGEEEAAHHCHHAEECPPHTHKHEHHHSAVAEINGVIDGLPISEKVREDAKAVYRLIAEAEAQVHGQPVEHIHFHEVGTLDAVADVVGVCLLMEKIGAEQVVVSPVNVGSGTVECAHGTLPVPAPATAILLTGIPVYSGDVQGELCTPTGAALLKYFGNSFAQMPQMTIEKTGYGMGTKDFAKRPNCLRAMLGDAESEMGQVVELVANLDDMTAEEMAFAMEILLHAGALDVYTEPITMKKSRSAVKFVCMCREEDRESLTRLMFQHTTTIGIREYRCRRRELTRQTEMRKTAYGEVRCKVCRGFGVEKEKWEFEDLAEISRETGKSIFQIRKEIHE